MRAFMRTRSVRGWGVETVSPERPLRRARATEENACRRREIGRIRRSGRPGPQLRWWLLLSFQAVLATAAIPWTAVADSSRAIETGGRKNESDSRALAPDALQTVPVIRNEARGLFNRFPLDSTKASVALRRTGAVVSQALGEISPNEVTLASLGNEFVLELLPTFREGDTGIRAVTIVLPAGFAQGVATGVRVNGADLEPTEAEPAEGQFGKTDPGGEITVTLGAPLRGSPTRFSVAFTADAPGPVGTCEFACVLSGPGRSRDVEPGDADANPANANTMMVEIVRGVSPVLSRVTADPIQVVANGRDQSQITTLLFDDQNRPQAGKGVVLRSSRGDQDIVVQPSAPTDSNGAAVGYVSSRVIGLATITATDTTDRIVAADQPRIAFTQGVVLDLRLGADRDQVVIGDLVRYTLEVRNPSDRALEETVILNWIPPNFRLLPGSARWNGAAIPDPAGNRPLRFSVGGIGSFADGNGNRRVDPGETGYAVLTYDLVVGSGANPGEYLNAARAVDVCDECFVSNRAESVVQVTTDPLFELGTIIGKVFEDTDEDGRQDRDERGVPRAMVALDEGVYALTDPHGRYHFQAVNPGYHGVKVNLGSLSGPARATTDETQAVWISPGLLGKANFGVVLARDTSAIGSPGVPGLRLGIDARREPIELVGSVETMDLLVNGQPLRLPGTEVELRYENLETSVELRDGRLAKPLEFRISAGSPERAVSWSLLVYDETDEVVLAMRGEGGPDEIVRWDGTRGGHMVLRDGGLYRYRSEVVYASGVKVGSPDRLFGVNRRSVMTLHVPPGGFGLGEPVDGSAAQAGLQAVARLLREAPHEDLVLRTAVDSLAPHGPRAGPAGGIQGAVAFLESNGVEDRRLVVQAGEPELRQPGARVNDLDVAPDIDGRLEVQVPADSLDSLRVEMLGRQGRSVSVRLAVPEVEILEPQGNARLRYGLRLASVEVPVRAVFEAGSPERAEIRHRLRGRTDPRNRVFLDGESLPLAADGTFESDLRLRLGRNVFGLLVGGPDGASRIVNLTATLSDRDDRGALMMVVDPIPSLVAELPAGDGALRSALQVITGRTEPGNEVKVNGEAAAVDADGAFSAPIDLPPGKSKLVVEVRDPAGHSGRIEREVTVCKNDLFLLALADGVIGQMRTSGHLEGSGQSDRAEFYTEGRIAFYLKGRIQGRYLLTAAFNSGQDEFENLFKNLDDAGNDRLLTNLDPDRFYPVYGDGSVTVYDTDSQGKFYLAVESEEFSLILGNYGIRFDDTELAAYQRVVFGGRLSYRSASESRDGEPNTQIVVFGSEGRREHVRTEIRATGGSFYYLRHADIVEGSEQVTLVVRDKNTGVPLSRTAQSRDQDYGIKYREGRIWFNRPIPSTVEGGSIAETEILGGHPVYLEVEYEISHSGGEVEGFGARVKQRLADRVSLGGTFVRDTRGARRNELRGLDAVVDLPGATRLLGEYAESEGADSLLYVTSDGGVSYDPVRLPGRTEGQAWRAAAELHPGAWLGRLDLIDLQGYVKKSEPGFQVGGSVQDRGTEKLGANLGLSLGRFGRFGIRHETVDRLAEGAGADSLRDRVRIRTGEWSLARGPVRLGLEYQATLTEYRDRSTDVEYLSGRLEAELTRKLRAQLRHQETIDGPANDQTSTGFAYALTRSLSVEARASAGTVGESAEGALSLGSGRERIYLTERHSRKGDDRTTATVLGAERRLWSASRVFTEYQWQQRDREAQLVGLLGAEQRLTPLRNFQVSLSGEHSRSQKDDSGERASATALGLSYDNLGGIRAASKSDLRYQSATRKLAQFTTASHLELDLDSEFSLLANFRHGFTRDRRLDRTEAQFREHSLGLAYRPVNHDVVNGLARYTHLEDRRPGGIESSGAGFAAASSGGADPARGSTSGAVRSSSADVVSLETLLEPFPRLEWVEKFAGKIRRERSGSQSERQTHTYLSIHRLDLRVWRSLTTAVEYRNLWQREAGDSKQGWLTEAQWRLARPLRVGLGYNFTEFSDDEFSENDYSVYGWFLRIQGKY